jgi:hypothetical protein
VSGQRRSKTHSLCSMPYNRKVKLVTFHRPAGVLCAIRGAWVLFRHTLIVLVG